MDKRIQNLEKLKTHPMLGKLFKKLTKSEYAEVVAFINDNAHLDDNEFAFKANRWYLGVKPSPKHLTDMWAIVTQLK